MAQPRALGLNKANITNAQTNVQTHSGAAYALPIQIIELQENLTDTLVIPNQGNHAYTVVDIGNYNITTNGVPCINWEKEDSTHDLILRGSGLLSTGGTITTTSVVSVDGVTTNVAGIEGLSITRSDTTTSTGYSNETCFSGDVSNRNVGSAPGTGSYRACWSGAGWTFYVGGSDTGAVSGGCVNFSANAGDSFVLVQGNDGSPGGDDPQVSCLTITGSYNQMAYNFVAENNSSTTVSINGITVGIGETVTVSEESLQSSITITATRPSSTEYTHTWSGGDATVTNAAGATGVDITRTTVNIPSASNTGTTSVTNVGGLAVEHTDLSVAGIQYTGSASNTQFGGITVTQTQTGFQPALGCVVPTPTNNSNAYACFRPPAGWQTLIVVANTGNMTPLNAGDTNTGAPNVVTGTYSPADLNGPGGTFVRFNPQNFSGTVQWFTQANVPPDNEFGYENTYSNANNHPVILTNGTTGIDTSVTLAANNGSFTTGTLTTDAWTVESSNINDTGTGSGYAGGFSVDVDTNGPGFSEQLGTRVFTRSIGTTLNLEVGQQFCVINVDSGRVVAYSVTAGQNNSSVTLNSGDCHIVGPGEGGQWRFGIAQTSDDDAHASISWANIESSSTIITAVNRNNQAVTFSNATTGGGGVINGFDGTQTLQAGGSTTNTSWTIDIGGNADNQFVFTNNNAYDVTLTAGSTFVGDIASNSSVTTGGHQTANWVVNSQYINDSGTGDGYAGGWDVDVVPTTITTPATVSLTAPGYGWTCTADEHGQAAVITLPPNTPFDFTIPITLYATTCWSSWQGGGADYWAVINRSFGVQYGNGINSVGSFNSAPNPIQTGTFYEVTAGSIDNLVFTGTGNLGTNVPAQAVDLSAVGNNQPGAKSSNFLSISWPGPSGQGESNAGCASSTPQTGTMHISGISGPDGAELRWLNIWYGRNACNYIGRPNAPGGVVTSNAVTQTVYDISFTNNNEDVTTISAASTGGQRDFNAGEEILVQDNGTSPSWIIANASTTVYDYGITNQSGTAVTVNDQSVPVGALNYIVDDNIASPTQTHTIVKPAVNADGNPLAPGAFSIVGNSLTLAADGTVLGPEDDMDIEATVNFDDFEGQYSRIS